MYFQLRNTGTAPLEVQAIRPYKVDSSQFTVGSAFYCGTLPPDAICRIPVTKSTKAKRVEFRAPDASSNPYLCFAAILMAGLDGILNRIDPGDPVDKDLYELPAEEAKLIKQVPSSLGAVLDALEQLTSIYVSMGLTPPGKRNAEQPPPMVIKP